MNSGELKKAKRDVRRRVVAARDAIPQREREHRGNAIAERFLSLPELADAGTVMAFWSFGSEVPTAPLLRALHDLGVRVALPRIADGELRPVAYERGDATAETTFGAREPVDGTVVEPSEIDVVATPAVAFDRDGRRIGYGGGFYDRFFTRTSPGALRAGIGFDVQVLPEGEALPGGSFDLRVDVVVTESGTIRCRRER